MSKKMPTPLLDYYIIIPDKEEENTSGVIMPDDMKEKPLSGVVCAVGKGIQAMDTGVFIQMQASVGDRVSYSRFRGNSIIIEGVQHLIISQNELLLIL